MNNKFYLKMASENIRRNLKMYLPFIISSISTIMMTFVIISMATNPGLKQIPAGNNLQTILSMGYIVLIIFSIIFLFYIHSFLMKNRKREFGVYNILGMDKKHIMKVFSFEMLFIAVGSMVIGVIAGMIFNKFCMLIIRNMMDASTSLGFEFSLLGFGTTIVVFMIIFILILLGNIFQIRLANPIELLKSSDVGEKEPKTKIISAIIGLLLIGGGYYFLLTVQNPAQAILFIFLAVLAVLAGTYLLFMTGSIAVLKMLKNNKNYYYKSNHFIPVSGMIYRMKKNAVGLANITILSVIVIILFTAVAALFMVTDEDALSDFPSDVRSEVSLPDDIEDDGETLKEEANEMIERTSDETGTEIDDYSTHAHLQLVTLETSDGFEVTPDVYSMTNNSRPIQIYITDQNNYNELTGDNVSLNEGEAYIHGLNDDYTDNTLSLMNHEFSVSEKNDMQSFAAWSESVQEVNNIYYMIVPDMETVRQLEADQREIMDEYSFSTIIATEIHLEDGVSEQEQIEFGNQMESGLRNAGMDIINMETKADSGAKSMAFRGGVLFIALNLATLLLIMTVLIIYYKQTSEAYDDKPRFAIMRKVGLEQSEIKKAINSQILSVFFLPVIVTACHILGASLLLQKLFVYILVSELRLFPIALILAFIVFVLIYIIIYRITARVYYNIVK